MYFLVSKKKIHKINSNSKAK